MVNTKRKPFSFSKAIFYLATSLATTSVFAAGAGGANLVGICNLVDFVKSLIGAVAVLAVLVLVINSFFGKSALVGEIVEKVLIGCVVAVGAVALVSSTTLTVGC